MMGHLHLGAISSLRGQSYFSLQYPEVIKVLVWGDAPSSVWPLPRTLSLAFDAAAEERG